MNTPLTPTNPHNPQSPPGTSPVPSSGAPSDASPAPGIDARLAHGPAVQVPSPAFATVPTAHPSDANTMDALQVAIQAEIGTLRTTLGELQQLGPGTVLTLAQRHDGEVTLRLLDGSAFASGELVDVAGRIGVRITRLASFA